MSSFVTKKLKKKRLVSIIDRQRGEAAKITPKNTSDNYTIKLTDTGGGSAEAALINHRSGRLISVQNWRRALF